MRRLVISILFASVFAVVNGQVCTPDTNITSPGFYPKSLDVAYVDSSYKQVLQIRVFSDTIIDYAGQQVLADIDSINLDTILGLPAGLEYYCSRKNCSYTPDSTGCATLEGVPAKGQMGDYPLGIAITVYGKVFGISVSQKDTITQFTVIVDDLSLVEKLPSRSNIIYPNPSVSGSFILDLWLNAAIDSYVCVNSQGQQVNTSISNGRLQFDDPIPGIYLVTIQLSDGTKFNRKVIISD